MQGRKEEWVHISQREKAGVGKRAQPEAGEEGREFASRPVGGLRASEGVHVWGRGTAGRRGHMELSPGAQPFLSQCHQQ